MDTYCFGLDIIQVQLCEVELRLRRCGTPSCTARQSSASSRAVSVNNWSGCNILLPVADLPPNWIDQLQTSLPPGQVSVTRVTGVTSVASRQMSC